MNEVELLERVGDDLAFLLELTDIVRQDYPRQLSLLKQAFEDKNAEGVKQVGHELRGALANLAATEASATVTMIEEIAGSHYLSRAAPVLERLEHELNHVLMTLEALCRRPHEEKSAEMVRQGTDPAL